MKIELEFATDGEYTYSLGYVIIAENEDDEKVLNTIRNMHFFDVVKYAGMVDSDNGNVRKLMFENPNIIRNCLSGALKGTICKDHAMHIICKRNDFAPELTFAQLREIMESQLKTID